MSATTWPQKNQRNSTTWPHEQRDGDNVARGTKYRWQRGEGINVTAVVLVETESMMPKMTDGQWKSAKASSRHTQELR